MEETTKVADMPVPQNSRFKQPILTNKGRQMLIAVGAGGGTITYTNAVMYSQNINDKTVEEVRAMTGLAGQIMTAPVSNPHTDGNTASAEVSFSNATLRADTTFNVIGWFAKTDVDLNDQSEYLFAIIPTAKNDYPFIASSPDGASTESIDLQLDVAISDTANVTVNTSPVGMESKDEHKRDMDTLIGSLRQGYFELDLQGHDSGRLMTSHGHQLTGKQPIVETDITLSVKDKAADAKTVGDKFKALEQEVLDNDRNIRANYETKQDGLNTRNLALSNADKINSANQNIALNALGLSNLNNELLTNSTTINLTDHNGNSIANDSNSELTANKQFLPLDQSLVQDGKPADAKAVGDLIRTVFNVLNSALAKLIVDTDVIKRSVEDNDTLRNLTNRVMALEDKTKTK